MEDGKRLENLSWRLWNRETFCCEPRSKARSSIAAPKAAATDIPMPKLSTSLDSASSEELDDEYSDSEPAATTIPKARPELWRPHCSRGREKHITPVDLENIVKSIQHNQELEHPIELPMPTPSTKPSELPSITAPVDLSKLQLNDDTTITQPSHTSTADSSSLTTSRATLLESSASTVDTNDDAESQAVGSESSSNTEMSTHSIIRGFVPGGAPSSYRSQTNLAAAQPTPILKTSPQYAQSKPAKKKGAMFTIGTSSGEDESSLESHMYRSQLSESLRRPNSNLSSSSGKKQTSFKEEVAVGRAAHSPVFESDDEDEEGVSESAIEDDDDSSDWEDSDDQSGPSSVNEKELFQRVDSRPNLTSRRSLLTTLMHEPDRAKALANAASRSTPHIRTSRRSTPNGPSVATSPEADAQIPVHEQPARARPIIMTTSNTHPTQLALSPRTTRRNMLSTELTESLRKNLLWERQHRSTGNLAALKRRHTSNDVKNLRQHPEPAPILSHQDGPKAFTNDYFHAGLQEYHAKGW
jgi:hypothetical protein